VASVYGARHASPSICFVAAPHHDPDAETVDHPPEHSSGDLVSHVLSSLRLSGAIFLGAEFTAPWAYESPPSADLKSIFAPDDATRLILFHIVAEGRSWMRGDGGGWVEARSGQVVVLPYGDQRVVGSRPDVEPIPIGSLLSPPPWVDFPVIRYALAATQRLAFADICTRAIHSSSHLCGHYRRYSRSRLRPVRPRRGLRRIQYALDASERRRPLSTAAVAFRVGYDSEEANRAFNRAFGRPPALWRRLIADGQYGSPRDSSIAF
jgi:AraC-like DNA-binding protein